MCQSIVLEGRPPIPKLLGGCVSVSMWRARSVSPEVRSTNKTFKRAVGWQRQKERRGRQKGGKEKEIGPRRQSWAPCTGLAMSTPMLLKSLLPPGLSRGSDPLLKGILPMGLDSIPCPVPGEPAPNIQESHSITPKGSGKGDTMPTLPLSSWGGERNRNQGK